MTPETVDSLRWMGATVGCYALGCAVRRAARGHALANPALLTIIAVAALLQVTHTPYAVYARSTWVLTFLLAPATVALGLPLARNFGAVQKNLRGVGLSLAAGSLASMLSGVLLVKLMGGSKELAMSMLPKAATSPIAIAVAEQIGGQPALTAVLAILGGIVCAVIFRAVLGGLRLTHQHALGLAAGTAGSGIAGAQAATLGETPAAFAAIGIALNGLLTALLAPVVAGLFQ